MIRFISIFVHPKHLKKTLKLVLLALFILITAVQSALSQSVVPPSNYGVWNRGGDPSFDPSQPEYDYIKGVTKGPTWDEIQPNSSTDYVWTEMQDAIDLAYINNQLVTLKVNVGPQCPDWIYTSGVPLVETTGSRFDSFPYYLDELYIDHYYNMIDSFAAFIYDQPQEKQDLLSFIFPQNGATGDEVAYKGTLTSLSLANGHEISDEEWTAFRINSWNHWKKAFRDNKARPIPFLFNDVYPTSDEWQWVRDSIGDDFGIKNSNASARGHHLSREENWYEAFHDSLVNPQSLALFNRAEMDQSWTNALYDINVELGFYWGAISGLNSGLSIWDITTSALDTARFIPSIQESFRFFSKYAGEIYPEESTKGFIAFHEGLNAADSIKFPEADYGNPVPLNKNRSQALCDIPKYFDRGARMDHLDAVVKGQVWQRSNQTGYNDAGWEIWPTNYSRFISQIDPDAESIGLWRIGGTIDNDSPIYSRFARAFEHSTGRDTMLFQMHDEFFSQAADTVLISVIYYDSIAGSTWSLAYDAGIDNFKTIETVTCNGSRTWKTLEYIVTDAVMLHNGPQFSDFALINTDMNDDVFHMIEIEQLDGTFADNVSITSPKEGDRFMEGESVLVSAKGFDFQGIQSMRFGVAGSAFNEDTTEPYSYEFDNLPPGQHLLLVQMVDTEGNYVSADPVLINIIRMPSVDSVWITSPVIGDVFELGKSVTVFAEGFASAGIESIRFKLNSGGFANDEIAPYSMEYPDLPIGMHQLTVQMKDNNGQRITLNDLFIEVIEVCPENLNLSSGQGTSAVYSSANTILSTQIVKKFRDVNYDGSKFIELNPGFEAKPGSVFKAYIKGCDNNN